MKIGMGFRMGWEDSRKTSFLWVTGQRLMVRHKEGSVKDRPHPDGNLVEPGGQGY